MLSKTEIIKRVQECDSLMDFEETDKYIYAYDEQEDMHLYFKFLENLDFDNLFDFGTQKVDKDRFFKVLKECIDIRLFLMPEKIYFLNSKEELDTLLEEYPCQSMNFEDTMGITWTEDSIILINVWLIKKLISQDIEAEPFLNYHEEFNREVWQTLVHELKHMVCDIGLIISEEEMPIEEGSEDEVEDYCREIFETVIEETKAYICFE